MSTQIKKDIAVAILEEFVQGLQTATKNGGFNNKTMIWLIKAWSKAGIHLRGPGYHRLIAAYYIMKRDPAPSAQKKSQVLLLAMQGFLNMLSRHGISEGDYFNRADRAMTDFVWEYRKYVAQQPDGGKSEQEFVNLLTAWRSTPPEQLMKEVITNMDRHA
ncbi:MAG: hypothetical protein KJZ84_12220 [Bryobacteraceae bacterium]|nr:hypothetical protein [Bryobacteraceae bacterium]